MYGNYRKASLYQAAMPLLKLATNGTAESHGMFPCSMTNHIVFVAMQ